MTPSTKTEDSSEGFIIPKSIPTSVSEWLAMVQKEPAIDSAVKNGRKAMHVTQTTYESGSKIRQSEFLHLRAVWFTYRMPAIDTYYRDGTTTEYRGYVSEPCDDQADVLFKNMSRFWNRYLQNVKAERGLATDIDSGGWETVRFYQEMTCWHIEQSQDASFPAKVFKDGYHPPPSDTDGQGSASVGGAGGQGGAGNQDGAGDDLPARFHNMSLDSDEHTGATPTRTTQSRHDTPYVKAFGMAFKSDDNRPSADEMYPNTALLVLLEEIRKEISAEVPWFNWTLPRLALHLKATPESNKGRRTVLKDRMSNLMEAQVDGYLCYRNSSSSFSNTPLAICEAKPFIRSEHGERTLRQEAAEMACWIAEHGHKPEGLLQPSRSGKYRRLLVSQDRHEIYIIIGEYGQAYYEYITGKESLLGVAPPTKDAEFDAEANKRAAEGSGSYVEQSKTPGAARGRVGRAPAPVAKPKAKAPSMANPRSRKQPPPVDEGAAAAAEPTHRMTTRSQSRGAPELPSVDQFLVMHQFGPFITGRADHMERFVRRLIGFMLQLKTSAPAAGQAPAKTALGRLIPV